MEGPYAAPPPRSVRLRTRFTLVTPVQAAQTRRRMSSCRLPLLCLLLAAPLACGGDDDVAGASGGQTSAGGTSAAGGSSQGGAGPGLSGSSGQAGAAVAGHGGSGLAGTGGVSAGGQGPGGSGEPAAGASGEGPGGTAGSSSSVGGAGGAEGPGGSGQSGAGTGGTNVAGSGTAGTAGKAGSAGTGGTAPSDPCAGKAPTCPKEPATSAEGDGLVAIDRCAYPMAETGAWTTFAPLVEALGTKTKPVTLATVLGDLNRDAVKVTSVPGSPAGLKQAFRWDGDDFDKEWWIPQGLTGSPDADASGQVNGKQLVVVSWYHDLDKQPGATEEKGVRIAIVDVTNAAKPTYRLALLVEPTGTTSAPNFKAVQIHAGGIVWFGDYLYVADTGHGFRVFDTRKIFQVATDQDTIGCAGGTCRAGTYKYVLPQVGAYHDSSACDLLFSWVSLDRSVTPPTLVSGEYCPATTCGALGGRIFRWPLDAKTGRLASTKFWPSEAYFMRQKQVQGGTAHSGTFFLSSSAPAGGGGALYRVKVGQSKTSSWIDSPEDLMIDQPHGWIWSLSEAAGSRYVIGAALGSYPSP